MGRAIDMEKHIHALEQRIKLVEDALEEMIQTRVHHVDLTDNTNVMAEGVEVKPDEEFLPPAQTDAPSGLYWLVPKNSVCRPAE